jgi:hypothetical protein
LLNTLQPNGYNISPLGGHDVPNGYSEESRLKVSRVHKGKVSIIDKDGKLFKVDQNDPRYLSGELVGMTKGKTLVTNLITNETFYMSTIEYKNNKDVNIVSNTIYRNHITVKDKNNNFLSVERDDPRYLSGELVGIQKGKKFGKQTPLHKERARITRDKDRILCEHCNKLALKWQYYKFHGDKCKNRKL